MARTQAADTVKKIQYVQGLLRTTDSLTQRDLRNRVKDKFGTGLAFGIIAAIKRGENPTATPGKARKSKAPRVVGGKKRGPGRPPGSKNKVRKASVHGRGSRNGLSGSPQYFISVPAEAVLTGCDKKKQVREEITRLIAQGIDVDSIVVYGREDFEIQTKHVINF